MPDPRPISTLVFDVNETLLDLTTVEPLFQRVFGNADVMREWFAELILYSQALTLSGRHTPFGALAGGVLRMTASNKGVQVSDEDVKELSTRIGGMPAYADVKPGLVALRDAGFRLVTLTNSAPSPSPTPLEKAGISDLFDRHFSVADVSKYKPHPATYQMVADELGIELSDICMVACHLWDTIGAQSAGCMGAFIARPHNSVLIADDVPQPDIIASDLGDLAAQLGPFRPAKP
ncbi:haloacid dehalogenase type II [Falsirhodobacter algicola]|uniref:(S)-2-haloacid dehalogenase n=1 Tax=Falsirhodobacter algicola TaxID=2692330 RepID=A0A8J8SKM1_9RHOB|nr:haloacid dehalogenase type II [Falsirhodobacter algicola]QUS35562.1 haloacid dehalogenase type II [Falsirhodobacter algicola]